MASTSFVNMYIPKRKNFSLMDIMFGYYVLFVGPVLGSQYCKLYIARKKKKEKRARIVNT